ncbi:MAG: hypothetical protein ACOCSN_02595 [Halanaeroarchaeum sp.]
MTDIEIWQCTDPGTLVDDPETRKCGNCGGIDRYPLADEVLDEERGDETVEVDLERALERLAEGDG